MIKLRLLRNAVYWLSKADEVILMVSGIPVKIK